jgi:hypothetical protein
MQLLLDNSSDTVLSLKRFNHKVCGGAGCYILPSDHADTDQFAHFFIMVIEKDMANGTKGQGQAPPSGLPPREGQTACPPHPLGNFYGLVLRIASGATRDDADLEADRERFGCR